MLSEDESIGMAGVPIVTSADENVVKWSGRVIVKVHFLKFHFYKSSLLEDKEAAMKKVKEMVSEENFTEEKQHKQLEKKKKIQLLCMKKILQEEKSLEHIQ